MQVVADLHLHSKYSRAVSQDMDLPHLASWAYRKGIHLLSTGDWTHPIWLKELQSQLEETASGLYKLKQAPQSPHFLLSTEISSIYSQNGKGRRVHTLVFAPHFSTVEKINARLLSLGAHLFSDGRPTIGIAVKDLAELVLSVDPSCLIVPAHAWTPWYSVFGAFSGFDSLEEAFGDFAKYIFAIETGMSSDPAMNWQIKELENRSIVSFSDAHSPAKIGREATVFEVGDRQLSYSLIRQAIINSSMQTEKRAKESKNLIRAREFTSRASDSLPAPPSAGEGESSEPSEILYTVEFFPEEGKYHYTGHRNCQVVYSPEDTQKLGTTCPVCGKKLTLGVMHRVQALSSPHTPELIPLKEPDVYHTTWYKHPRTNRPSYTKIVPLQEIIAECYSAGFSTKKVTNEYERLTNSLGPEFDILLRTDTQKIARLSSPQVAEAIKKVRAGHIFISPGHDGVYGKVAIFAHTSPPSTPQQASLF